MRKRDAKRLLKRLVAGLEDSYDLIYVDYRDELNEKQVNAIVEGDTETLFDDLDSDWEYQSRHAGSTYVIEQITTEEEREALEQHDLIDELREAIEEREDGSWMHQLIGHTSDPLLRVCLADEDADLSFHEVSVDQFLTRTGLPDTEHNRKTAAEVIANASPEYSVNLLYALVTVDLKKLYDLPEDVTQVWITNPDIWMGSPFSGSGYCESFEGRILVKREDLHTDKSAFGYGWQDVVGQTWQTKDSDLFPVPPEGWYMQCGAHVRTDTPPWERCWLFVEDNPSWEDDPAVLAPYIHLHRGDDADEALDENHEAMPSMDIHPLDWWRENGPDKMKERFTDA
jgi:hypothetical protein